MAHNKGHLAPDKISAKNSSRPPPTLTELDQKRQRLNAISHGSHKGDPLLTSHTHCMDLQHPKLVATFKAAEVIIHTFQRALNPWGSFSLLPSKECKPSHIGHVSLPAPRQFLRERWNPKPRGLKGVILRDVLLGKGLYYRIQLQWKCSTALTDLFMNV